jgi:fused signal recognition particle receptor
VSEYIGLLIFGSVLVCILIAAIVIIVSSAKQRRIAAEAAKAESVAAGVEVVEAGTAEAPPTAPEPPEPALAEPRPLDAPEPAASRLTRLRRKLSAAENPFAKGLLAVLSAGRLDEQAFEDLESTLILADLGVGPTAQLLEALRTEAAVSGVADAAAAKAVLKAELAKLARPELDRTLKTTGADGLPAVVLVVGVNGTGKTTTVGKLARMLVADGQQVVLGAADTFRAAAADQLQTWGERVGVPTVRSEEGSDPASVAFEAVDAGIAGHADVVLIDTAGRLHTKTGLMDELGKVKRVVERKAPVAEVLLVLDATTGQNGLIQAKVFAEAVAVTGIVLTKLDGSAKGGIVFQVQQELDVPVKLIGLGEGPDDLAPFDVPTFVSALLDS